MRSLLRWWLSGFALWIPMSGSAQAVDLQSDARLSVRVSLRVKSKPLTACLEALGKESGIRLIAAKGIALRRATVFMTKRPLRQWMTALAEVTGLSWRVVDPNAQPVAYELYQSEEAREREARQIAASERREARGHELQKEALLKEIERAIAQRKPDEPSVADLLVGLTPEQRRQAAELSQEPTGVISASDQSHFHNHLLYATPLHRLSPPLQAAVAGMLNRPDYSPGAGESQLAPALEKNAALSQSYVGLIAADGGLALGVVGPEGKDVWVSPLDRIHPEGIPGYTSDNGMEPEVEEALSKSAWLDLRALPRSQRNRRIRFPKTLPRHSLPDILDYLAARTQLPFVSDDFVQSRRSTLFWLLTDQDEYTLEQALSQIAGAFGHRFVFRHGVMQVKTLTPGLDLRSEPPAELVASLIEKSEKRRPMTLEDYLLLARLPVRQFQTLLKGSIPGIGPGLGLHHVQRLYPVLNFYAALSATQRAQAESEKGLALRDMDARTQRAFRKIANVGMPKRMTDKEPPRRAGFYVQCESKGATVTHVFLIVSERQLPLTTAYRLTVHPPIPPTERATR